MFQKWENIGWSFNFQKLIARVVIQTIYLRSRIVNGDAFLCKKFPYFIQIEAFVWHNHKGKFISSKDYSKNTQHVVYEKKKKKVSQDLKKTLNEGLRHNVGKVTMLAKPI